MSLVETISTIRTVLDDIQTNCSVFNYGVFPQVLLDLHDTLDELKSSYDATVSVITNGPLGKKQNHIFLDCNSRFLSKVDPYTKKTTFILSYPLGKEIIFKNLVPLLKGDFIVVDPSGLRKECETIQQHFKENPPDMPPPKDSSGDDEDGGGGEDEPEPIPEELYWEQNPDVQTKAEGFFSEFSEELGKYSNGLSDFASRYNSFIDFGRNAVSTISDFMSCRDLESQVMSDGTSYMEFYKNLAQNDPEGAFSIVHEMPVLYTNFYEEHKEDFQKWNYAECSEKMYAEIIEKKNLAPDSDNYVEFVRNTFKTLLGDQYIE